MPETFEVVLPSLPLIQNDRIVLGSIEVPTVGDIRTTVDRLLVGIELDLDRAVDDLTDEISTGVEDVRGDVGDLRTDLDQLIQPVIDEAETAILDSLEGVEADVVATVEESVGGVIEELTATVGRVEAELTEDIGAVDELVDQALQGDFQDIEDQVSGVSGSLASLGDALGSVQTGLTGLDEDFRSFRDGFPSQVEEAAQDALSSALEELGIQSFLDDPAGELGQAVIDRLPGAVDDESLATLQAALED